MATHIAPFQSTLKLTNTQLPQIHNKTINYLKILLSEKLSKANYYQSIFCYHCSHGFSPMATYIAPFQGALKLTNTQLPQIHNKTINYLKISLSKKISKGKLLPVYLLLSL